MSEFQRRPDQMDAEDAERLQQGIDATQGPGPVLDQNDPAPMPLFEENERAEGEPAGAIDPAEFAELTQRSGEELDGIRPIEGGDAPGVAGRAQPSPDPDAAA
jgi:hypothetical protein